MAFLLHSEMKASNFNWDPGFVLYYTEKKTLKCVTKSLKSLEIRPYSDSIISRMEQTQTHTHTLNTIIKSYKASSLGYQDDEKEG